MYAADDYIPWPDRYAQPDDDEPEGTSRLERYKAAQELKAIRYLKETRVREGKALLEVIESLYNGVPDDTEAVEDLETMWGICRKYWGKAIK